MSRPAQPTWVADPTVSWTILLSAGMDDPPALRLLEERLRRMSRELGWPTPPPVLVGDDLTAVRRSLVLDRGTPVRLGRAADTLVVAAHHAHVDGIGLLGVLGRLLDREVTSSARGIEERGRRHALATSALARVREVALHPPARVRGTADGTDPYDVLAERAVPGRRSTAAVAHAALGALAGRVDPGRQLALAIGASRRSGDRPDIADRSALLRLTHVDADDGESLRERIRRTPVEPDLAGAGVRPVGRGAFTAALRVLRPRLGSTLLVSHLGEVSAPGVHDLAFHPVSAGGSGVALGAVGFADRTVLGLRARGSTHAPADLDVLLEDVASRLRRS